MMTLNNEAEFMLWDKQVLLVRRKRPASAEKWNEWQSFVWLQISAEYQKLQAPPILSTKPE